MKRFCPLCDEHTDDQLTEILAAYNGEVPAGWTPSDKACSRCWEKYPEFRVVPMNATSPFTDVTGKRHE